MHQFAGTSLKTRLYLLVLAAFIPVTLLIVYVAQEQRTIEKEAVLDKTRLMAQAAADAENMQVEATRDLMAAVAGTFQRFAAQPAGMSSLLADLIGHTQGYAALGIIDPAGRLMAGSNTAVMEMVAKIIAKNDRSIVLAIGHATGHDDNGHCRQEPIPAGQYGS